MLLDELSAKKLISPPLWLNRNVHYLSLMGSVAYGVSSDTSDMDVYGWCIPEKVDLFPHLRGEILGFGTNKQRFEQFQQHHVFDQDAMAGKGRNYDFSIYSIVKFFQLCMENNPNMVDALFVPQNCILHITAVGNMVREQRKIFLHKGCFHKFKGYAFSQMHKMSIKTPQEGSKRDALVKQHGYDTKFAYHIIRLIDEVEQILTTGDLDLQRSKEHMKAVRRGEVTEEEIKNYFSQKEKDLEKLYAESTLPHSPDEGKIKTLLLQCLEQHYGSLEKCIVAPDIADQTLTEIEKLVEKYRRLTR
jgi:predicted nucleotidyltransferase